MVADARYVGRAKKAARRIPRPPAFTGKLACILCMSDKTKLASLANVRFKNFVNLTKNSIANIRRAAQYEKNM